MMSDQLVGFGLLGAGFMGRTYAEVLARHVRNARLVGVASGTRAADLAAAHGAIHFDSLDAMLADPAVRAVIVATPQAAHVAQALAAARAGRHLLIEKPMATSVADCDAIIAACRERDLRLGVSFTQRPRLCNVKARELIVAGALGELRHVRHVQIMAGGYETLPPWQREMQNLGTLLGYGVHNIDGIRWLTGREVTSVYARCANWQQPAGVEAVSDLLMSLEGDLTATLHCASQVPRPGFPRSMFSAQIVGSKGLIDLDAYGELRVSLEGGPWEVLATQPPIDWQGKGMLDPVRLVSYATLVQDFIDAVCSGREPMVTGWDGRQATAVALAAYESSRRRAVVEL